MQRVCSVGRHSPRSHAAPSVSRRRRSSASPHVHGTERKRGALGQRRARQYDRRRHRRGRRLCRRHNRRRRPRRPRCGCGHRPSAEGQPAAAGANAGPHRRVGGHPRRATVGGSRGAPRGGADRHCRRSAPRTRIKPPPLPRGGVRVGRRHPRGRRRRPPPPPCAPAHARRAPSRPPPDGATPHRGRRPPPPAAHAAASPPPPMTPLAGWVEERKGEAGGTPSSRNCPARWPPRRDPSPRRGDRGVTAGARLGLNEGRVFPPPASPAPSPPTTRRSVGRGRGAARRGAQPLSLSVRSRGGRRARAREIPCSRQPLRHGRRARTPSPPSPPWRRAAGRCRHAPAAATHGAVGARGDVSRRGGRAGVPPRGWLGGGVGQAAGRGGAPAADGRRPWGASAPPTGGARGGQARRRSL